MHNWVAAAVAVAFTVSAVAAEGLSEPSGDVLLTIRGDIAETNGDGVARFDRPMLEAMPSITFSTSTIWTEGTQEFTGVPLSAILDSVGAAGDTALATAINDYAVQIPRDDWGDAAPIVAYEMNGAPMSVRDKGPLWIVYPYDSDATYRSEVIYARSIWQLDRIVIDE